MPNNGLIKTEWTITLEHITQGYISINYRTDWLPLVSYNWLDEDWTAFYSSGHKYSIGKYTGALKIKFGLVNSANTLLTMSSDTLYIGYRKNITLESPDSVPYMYGPHHKLNTNWLYMSIK